MVKSAHRIVASYREGRYNGTLAESPGTSVCIRPRDGVRRVCSYSGPHKRGARVVTVSKSLDARGSMWTCQMSELVVPSTRWDRPGEPQTSPGAEDVRQAAEVDSSLWSEPTRTSMRRGLACSATGMATVRTPAS